MTEVIRSDGIEIKKKVIQQILLRGSGDSKFNNHINKSLKLLPPSDNLRIISNDNYTLAKMSFDQWNLIFEKEIEIKKLNKILDDLNKSPLILATNISDSQVFFEIQGKNSFDILNKLTHEPSASGTRFVRPSRPPDVVGRGKAAEAAAEAVGGAGA